MFDVYAVTFKIDASIFPPAKFGTFGEVASAVVLILTSVAGAAAIILIIISGIKIVTSGGDPKQLGAAQATLTYAIIGLAVTILAFVILAALQKFLGSSLAL
jgi:hypothetical protein